MRSAQTQTVLPGGGGRRVADLACFSPTLRLISPTSTLFSPTSDTNSPTSNIVSPTLNLQHSVPNHRCPAQEICRMRQENPRSGDALVCFLQLRQLLVTTSLVFVTTSGLLSPLPRHLAPLLHPWSPLPDGRSGHRIPKRRRANSTRHTPSPEHKILEIQ